MHRLYTEEVGKRRQRDADRSAGLEEQTALVKGLGLPQADLDAFAYRMHDKDQEHRQERQQQVGCRRDRLMLRWGACVGGWVGVVRV